MGTERFSTELGAFLNSLAGLELDAFLDGISAVPMPAVDQWELLLEIHGDSGSPVLALLMELQAMGFSKDELLGICYREGVLLKHDVLHSQLCALRDGWNAREPSFRVSRV